jgi:hypothetical protein
MSATFFDGPVNLKQLQSLAVQSYEFEEVDDETQTMM